MVTAKPACAAPPSTFEYVVETPARLSDALKWTVKSALRQPTGASELVTGAVRSILMWSTVALDSLSARSETDAEADSADPSPLITLLAGHEPAIPESASLHVQWIVTSPAYQPFPFGAVVGAPLIVGAVLSMLSGPTVVLALLPAAST